jgi:hypothetical protein
MSNKYNRYYCTKCEDLIYSSYQGEFKLCKCGSSFVDETDYYLRWGGKAASLQELIYIQLEDLLMEKLFY